MPRCYMAEDKGYVIRSVDSFSGRVTYQGKREVISEKKDSIRMKDTFTLKGARVTLGNFERKYPDYFFSIERLSCCYFQDKEIAVDKNKERDSMLQDIEEAMRRLDELWDGNDFDRGDKMRINVVRNTLKSITEELLEDK